MCVCKRGCKTFMAKNINFRQRDAGGLCSPKRRGASMPEGQVRDTEDKIYAVLSGLRFT